MPVLDNGRDGCFRGWVTRSPRHVDACWRDVELDARSWERCAEPDVSGERSPSQDGDGEGSDSNRDRGQLDASHSLAARWVLEVPAVIRSCVATAAGRISTAAQVRCLLLFEKDHRSDIKRTYATLLYPQRHHYS